jgi:enediyne biosynthesis protein E4
MGCPKNTSGSSDTVGAREEASIFRNVLAESGIHYQWEIAGKRPLNILQTIGNGAAFLDFDGDKNLDILLVGPRVALYRGDGKGKFTDVSEPMGMAALTGHLTGCAVGDYDGDGFSDIYLTGWRDGRLLHNEAGKRFVDVTAAQGLQPEPWGTSAAFVPRGGNSGALDLVVCNYAIFGPEPGIKQLCDAKDASGKTVLTSCGPRTYTPHPATLYRFSPQSKSKAQKVVLKASTGRGLGVAALLPEEGGNAYIAFANDEISGDLLQEGPHGFTNLATTAGTAYDRDGNVHGGMGTDWGDIENDGRLDLVVATFQNETKSLYRNEGSGVFSDMAYPAGVGSTATPLVTFGVRFFDFNNDGWLDIALANGHVQDNIAEIDRSTTFRQGSQLIQNKGMGTSSRASLEDISKQCPDLQKPIVGRGLATGDYDNDGRVDLLIVDAEGEPLLLHNEATTSHHWLGLRLIGAGSNRDAYGAQVTVEVAGRKIVRHCHADGSYMSSSDARVHFGLGAATTLERVTIRWPSGQTQTLTDVPLDQYIDICEKSK